MTLRERQKTSRREAILDAARLLFYERTYTKTTMEAIAEEAEVGVATLYNYFGTKEGVLAELAKLDLTWIRNECDAVKKDPPSDPALAMQLLFEPYEKSRTLATDEMISMYLAGAKRAEGPLRAIGRWADRWMRSMVLELLAQGQKKGDIAPDVEIDEIAEIILTLFHHYYFKGFRSEGGRAANAFDRFLTQIPLLFNGWSKNTIVK